METPSLALNLEHDGNMYSGWATPSDQRHQDGYARSYHVVLNGIFFGDLSLDNGKWIISEQRPHSLVEATGKAIQDAEQVTK